MSGTVEVMKNNVEGAFITRARISELIAAANPPASAGRKTEASAHVCCTIR